MSTLGAMAPPGTTLTLVTPTFPVPIPAPPSGSDPAERPARFAGVPLHWLSVAPNATITSFARAAQRIYKQLAPGLPGDTTTAGLLLELSPLPGFFSGALRQLAGGCPVQYVLLNPQDAALNDDNSVVDVEAPVATLNFEAWVALAFQDRVCRDPRAWSQALDDAAQAGNVDRTTGWPSFATTVAASSTPRVRLLDHTGRPLTTGAVQITTGGTTHDVTLTPASDGDSGVDIVAGAAQISTAGAGALLASADSDTGELAAPLSLTDTDRHVLVSDTADWLSPRSPNVTKLAPWTPGNTFEPIVDGIPYFARLVQDMRASWGVGGAVELADWGFVIENLQDETKRWSLIPEDNSTEILALIDELFTHDVEVLVLLNRFLQTTQEELEAIRATVAVLLVLSVLFLGPAGVTRFLVTDTAGWVLLAAGLTLIPALTDALLRDALVAVAEPSNSALVAINGAHPNTAWWTPYPAALADNPLVSLPLTIADIPVGDDVNNVGVYHHKLAITRAPGSDPVAYLGGIDIDPNRMDDPLHRAAAPFHDIQVRLTGPAANDVVWTFSERATYHGATAPITPVDDWTTLTGDGPHVVQVGRTYFAPGPGRAGVAFGTAPTGEHTTHETVLHAIANASEYIYIEDQYFTPDDQTLQALLAAAAKPNLQLVVTLVEDNGQLLGELRRNDVIGRLTQVWGDRFRIGTPLRRYLNPEPATFGGLGRMVLRADLPKDSGQMVVGPAERCPAPPFWAFVESELVHVDSVVANGAGTGQAPGGDALGPDDDPKQTWQQVNVQRSVATTAGSVGWGAKVDDHDQDNCVLAVQIPAIYVHAKLLIVDDVFVGVGTTNFNRRSFEHDGEIHAFAIPTSLKRDPTNPALRLRCRVWAEHFGLPPELGLSLLADPLSALSYFDRSWYRGSRWQPLQVQAETDPLVAIPISGSAIVDLVALAVGYIVGDADRDTIWATFVEPTTANDPNVDPATDKGPLV